MNRWVLAFAAAALVGGCHKKSAEAPAANAPTSNRPAVQIAATGNIWGQVEPCG